MKNLLTLTNIKHIALVIAYLFYTGYVFGAEVGHTISRFRGEPCDCHVTDSAISAIVVWLPTVILGVASLVVIFCWVRTVFSKATPIQGAVFNFGLMFVCEVGVLVLFANVVVQLVFECSSALTMFTGATMAFAIPAGIYVTVKFAQYLLRKQKSVPG